MHFLHNQKALLITSVIVVLGIALIGGFALVQRDSFNFEQHQRVSASGSLVLRFPENMDHASVEEFLSIPSHVQTQKSWKGEALILTPTEALHPGDNFIITVDARARTSAGNTLEKDIIFRFDVMGALAVTAQIPPTHASSVQPNARIVIVFDRPFVPLSQVQGGGLQNSNASWPVKISPTIAGRWRWLGTTSVQFVPDVPLKRGTAYTVSVPAGLRSFSGDVTEKDFSWTFETDRPLLLSSEPVEGSQDAGSTTKVTLHFNQDMDLATARNFLSIAEGTSASVPVGTVTYGTKEEEKGTKVTDKTSLVVSPATPFLFRKQYSLQVKSGIRGLEGTLGSVSGAVLHFQTVGPLSVNHASFDHNQLVVDFSNPIDDASLSGAINFSPALAGLKASDLVTQDWNGHKKLELYEDFLPSTKYKLTISKALTDKFGQHISEPYEYSWTTPKLSPRLFLHPEGSNFSIFEKGKSPVYFVNNLNVSRVTVTMGSLPLDTFLKMRGESLRHYEAYDMDVETVGKVVRSWDLKTSTKKLNTWESLPTDITKQYGSPLDPGLYALSVTSPEIDERTQKPLKDVRVFAVTNMGVVLKYSGDKTLVWVTNLQTGEPVKAAEVELRSVDGSTPVKGITDNDGFFEGTMKIEDFVAGQNNAWRPEFWVIVRKGDDLAFAGSDWNAGFQPYDFDGVMQDFRSPQLSKFRLLSMLQTERPLYRAGDTVHIKGTVRFLDWSGKMTIPNHKIIDVSVTDPSGKEVFSKTMTMNEYGSFDDTFTVDPSGSLGYYSVVARFRPDSDVGEQSQWASFQVLAYRKPEYKVTVTPSETDYFAGQTVKASILGQYYFGAPMDKATVEWRAISSDYYFNRYTDGWYSFALQGAWCWYECQSQNSILTEGHGALDSQGKLDIQFPLTIDDKSVSQIVTIEADITDKNNQVVSSRQDVIVHKSKVYVGIKSNDYVVTPGKTAQVSVVTVSPDGKPSPKKTVQLTLHARTWNTVKQKNVDGNFYYDNKPIDTFVRSLTVTTDENGKGSTNIQIDTGGEFVVVASVKDSDGREPKASTGLYAWSETYFNWPHANNDRLDIVADKPTYKVGDIAKLLVKSPFQGKGVKALVTVERENVITKKVIDITSNAMPIEVPVTDDLLPTAYVSVVIIKPRIGETFNENGLDTGAPAFRIGYIKLPIDTSPRVLDVKIQTDKEKYLPGETVKVTLSTKDAKGTPVAAELSLGTVDMSLLDLAGFRMPDVVSMFYGQRGLGVITSSMMSFLMERFKPGSKGGGGGLEALPRGLFKDTAYWNPRILTDKNGQATVSFTLPDNLTTWQLLAIGSTKSHLFGAATKNIIETKHVILRPVRPRFAVIGDKIQLGAIVHNDLDTAASFSVSLDGKGFTGNATKKIMIPQGQDVKVLFPVTVTDASGMTMHFIASTDNARDEITETIPVVRFGVQQTNATSGIVDTVAVETLAVPSKTDASEGTFSLKLSPTIAVYLASGLEYLANYPYGCAEQVVSTFLPNVVLKKLQGFDAFRIVDDATLTSNIESGLQKVYLFQKGDGGFGYWNESTKSYPRLTAYVLSALTMTKNAGYAVDEGVINRARDFLLSALHTKNIYGELADPSTRAYVLYVLSEERTIDVALLNNLYKDRATLPMYARAYLAMAYQNTATTEAKARANALVQDLLGHVHVDARGAEFQEDAKDNGGISMNTNARTTAIALQALLRIDPQNPLIPKLVRGILSSRENGHWDTTQSTVASLLAFIEYIRQTDELNFDFTAKADVDAKNVLTHAFRKGSALASVQKDTQLSDMPRGKTIDINIGKEGKGKLYYDAALSYFYTPKIIEPAEEGIGILREMEPLTGSSKSPKVGSTYKVTLTITVPETRHFVAVESPLPAGMEAIDLHLATSQQGLLQGEVNRSPENWWESSFWYFSHTEFRDDQVFLFADELPPGVYTYQYLARATTPGTFHVRPAKVWEMYFPENFGQTQGDSLTIAQ